MDAETKKAIYNHFLLLTDTPEEAKMLLEMFEEVYHNRCEDFEIDILQEIFGDYPENN